METWACQWTEWFSGLQVRARTPPPGLLSCSGGRGGSLQGGAPTYPQMLQLCLEWPGLGFHSDPLPMETPARELASRFTELQSTFLPRPSFCSATALVRDLEAASTPGNGGV